MLELSALVVAVVLALGWCLGCACRRLEAWRAVATVREAAVQTKPISVRPYWNEGLASVRAEGVRRRVAGASRSTRGELASILVEQDVNHGR